MSGKGVLLYHNGDVFQGFWYKDKIDSKGWYTTADGVEYEELWEDGKEVSNNHTEY